MTEQYLYYFGLYAVVLGLSFWNQINEYFFKQDTATPESQKKFHWLRILFVGNEILFAASGIYVAFIKLHPTWSAPLLVALLMMVIFSTYTTGLTKFLKEKHQLKTHLIVMVFIFGLTFYTLSDSTLYPDTTKIGQTNTRKDTTYCFNIAIPYTDQTIVRDYGNERTSDKLFVYYTEDTAKSEKEAIKKAMVIFEHDSAIQPLRNKNHVDKMTILRIQKNKILTTRTNL